jgi:hypothetical protein
MVQLTPCPTPARLTIRQFLRVLAPTPALPASGEGVAIPPPWTGEVRRGQTPRPAKKFRKCFPQNPQKPLLWYESCIYKDWERIDAREEAHSAARWFLASYSPFPAEPPPESFLPQSISNGLRTSREWRKTMRQMARYGLYRLLGVCVVFLLATATGWSQSIDLAGHAASGSP